jgi:hypothetical protein
MGWHESLSRSFPLSWQRDAVKRFADEFLRLMRAQIFCDDRAVDQDPEHRRPSGRKFGFYRDFDRQSGDP